MAENKSLTYDRIKKITETDGAKIHFTGVGGVSMYSLASIIKKNGSIVSGSDTAESDRTRKLAELGAEIFIGHSPSLVNGASLLVHSHAIPNDDPEIEEAKKLGTPIVSRAEFMGSMMIKYKNKIGVSGSHGKSTTVAMLDSIFTLAGKSPDVLSGADLPFGEPYKTDGGETLIYEGCEYKDSFLSFTPSIFIALNLELDHTDYFKDMSALRSSFARAMNKAGLVILSGDDPQLTALQRDVRKRIITYGQGERSDYRYSISEFRERGFGFEVFSRSKSIGKFEINIPGVFNVSNATAAIVAALESGIDVETAARGISAYRGIKNRIERVGVHLGRAVYYDYAHHPTEISSVINAVKMETHDEVTVIFKPHTYSRTKSLWEDFRSSLSLADYLILTDIYPARETAIRGVSSERLAREIGGGAMFCEDASVREAIDRFTHGAIIIMGAGGLEEIRASVEI